MMKVTRHQDLTQISLDVPVTVFLVDESIQCKTWEVNILLTYDNSTDRPIISIDGMGIQTWIKELLDGKILLTDPKILSESKFAHQSIVVKTLDSIYISELIYAILIGKINKSVTIETVSINER